MAASTPLHLWKIQRPRDNQPLVSREKCAFPARGWGAGKNCCSDVLLRSNDTL